MTGCDKRRSWTFSNSPYVVNPARGSCHGHDFSKAPKWALLSLWWLTKAFFKQIPLRPPFFSAARDERRFVAGGVVFFVCLAAAPGPGGVVSSLRQGVARLGGQRDHLHHGLPSLHPAGGASGGAGNGVRGGGVGGWGSLKLTRFI